MMHSINNAYGKDCKETQTGKHGNPGSEVPARRLDDRIRYLCAKVVDASEDELFSTVADLQAGLREHSDRVRRLAGRKLTAVWSNHQQFSS